MRIERYRPRPHYAPASGCFVAGLLALMLLAGLIVVGIVLTRLPEIGLRIAGFQPAGETESVLATVQTTLPPAELSPVSITRMRLDVDELGQPEVPVSGVNLERGTDSTGRAMMRASLSPQAILSACTRVSDVCSGTNERLRVSGVDLRPGGLLVQADVNLGIWQPVTFVVQLGAGPSLRIVGVDVDGALYALPAGELTSLAHEAENVVNRVLPTLAIEIDGVRWRLNAVQISEDQLLIELQS